MSASEIFVRLRLEGALFFEGDVIFFL